MITGNTTILITLNLPICQFNLIVHFNICIYLTAFKSLQALNLELTLKEKELAEAIEKNTEDKTKIVKILNKKLLGADT